MAAQTTTGITLRHESSSGDYIVQRPGQPEVRLTNEQAGDRPFDAAQDAAGLTSGYWLSRGTIMRDWTWVQL